MPQNGAKESEKELKIKRKNSIIEMSHFLNRELQLLEKYQNKIPL